jgi:hypothetical protein
MFVSPGKLKAFIPSGRLSPPFSSPNMKQMVATCRALVIKDCGGTGGCAKVSEEGSCETRRSEGSVKTRNIALLLSARRVVNPNVA